MSVVSKTHVGLVREVNEDAILVRKPRLFAIADGMGGYAAGEIASRETLQIIANDAVWFYTLNGADLVQAMREAVINANRYIQKLAIKNAEYHDMGTTLVMVYLPGDGKAYILNIGDSRCYLLRDSILKQVTKDHSLVSELLEKGEITEREAFTHPKRNIILRALGAEEKVEVDVFIIEIQSNDKLLLCSDGLSDMLENETIKNLLQKYTGEDAAEQLLEAALDNGGRDNISLILLDELSGGQN